jgi:hypothetical protein
MALWFHRPRPGNLSDLALRLRRSVGLGPAPVIPLRWSQMPLLHSQLNKSQSLEPHRRLCLARCQPQQITPKELGRLNRVPPVGDLP